MGIPHPWRPPLTFGKHCADLKRRPAHLGLADREHVATAFVISYQSYSAAQSTRRFISSRASMLVCAMNTKDTFALQPPAR
jgi:hypothetical protein